MKEQKNNREILLPENTVEIIFELIKKYELQKPEETLFSILRDNKKLAGEEIIDLTKEIIEGKIKEADLASELQKRFTLSENQAEGLTKDIESKLILRSRKRGMLSNASSNQEYQRKNLSDMYREPTE